MFDLARAEEKVKAYRYSRTFGATQTEATIADTDKDVLSEYIKGILGAGAPKSGSTDNRAK